ncbi:VOC family protein [Bradyrhizobium sp. U87765 SZCCT0131]|uniref:VOC family protein n=1 Tax=unclassified Bradyrhizobium TaxID=2631580 RepID=UPI001BA891EE|nr:MULTISPECIES: VOC family protein [unclassified Bradyrhizobium]MBR1219004.1 VOC family protein [Bradyrhizobium sp. U87765 SZCCT0131]MBR1261655.1 VOC family protein [Bradyrhizobium sp. U87765 SZCCT0134]MBR1306492.1 VOC family protein [Bradyrhizobium sp. U87765 SZCCT0110]MBR1317437.1 VOC family protein [Bradyrhizobium sp. U87765 SZCCT0109]MBR1351139.1 VOC family protein [Bradyrhizobium sp. U87765 SZCCT0048]
MPLTALQASAYLHHLHLHSPDPERLAAFYARAMEMTAQRADGGFRLDGPSRRLLISEGPAKHLAHAAFAVRDAKGLAGLRAHAAGNGLAPRDLASPLLSDAFEVTDPDGNAIVFGLATEAPHAADRRLRGPLQHLTLATRDVGAIEAFYAGKLGFGVSDRVVREDGKVMTCFMRGNHEHHNLACFYQDRQGIDHHSYEAGEWGTLRDWCDNLAAQDIQLMWGPGRHGPGNNLFIFIEDPDGNWIEISAELEVVHDRPVKHWPHAPRTLNLWGNAIMRA